MRSEVLGCGREGVLGLGLRVGAPMVSLIVSVGAHSMQAGGANPHVENARDLTPAEVAAGHHFTEFAELVRATTSCVAQ
jgi:hypothetical protein